MTNLNLTLPRIVAIICAAVPLIGCQTTQNSTVSEAAAPAAPAQVAPAAPAPAPAQAPITTSAIRINCGASVAWTNTDGTVWLPDENFEDGDVIERPDLEIKNTDIPEIYRSEHYGMTLFTYPAANGKYTVKLHFCETYEGITDVGERVFSFNVQGKDFKDFDVYKVAGGAQIAHVITVPIEVTNNKVQITFTPNVENPQINGIEIIPQS